MAPAARPLPDPLPLHPPWAAGPLTRPCAAGLAGARPGSGSSGGGPAVSVRRERPGRAGPVTAPGPPGPPWPCGPRGESGDAVGDELACSAPVTLQHGETRSEKGPRCSVFERTSSKTHYHLHSCFTDRRNKIVKAFCI